MGAHLNGLRDLNRTHDHRILSVLHRLVSRMLIVDLTMPLRLVKIQVTQDIVRDMDAVIALKNNESVHNDLPAFPLRSEKSSLVIGKVLLAFNREKKITFILINRDPLIKRLGNAY